MLESPTYSHPMKCQTSRARVPVGTSSMTTSVQTSKKRVRWVKLPDAIRVMTAQYGPFEAEPRLDPVHELVFTILSQHTSDINSARAFRLLMEEFGSLEAVGGKATVIGLGMWLDSWRWPLNGYCTELASKKSEGNDHARTSEEAISE